MTLEKGTLPFEGGQVLWPFEDLIPALDRDPEQERRAFIRPIKAYRDCGSGPQ